MKKKDIEAIYPLTPMQEGMLFHSLYAPTSGVYVQQVDGVVRGALDLEAFRRAWQRALDRHPSLRTAFLSEGLEKPLQVVGRRVALPLEVEDWSALADDERRERLERFLVDDRRRGFRMSRAPLMRLFLARLGEAAWHFVWTHHHILVDGWSVSILLKEVFDLYQAVCEGVDLPLADCRPYSDYIAWLGRQDLALAEAHWQEALAGFASPTALIGLAARRETAPAEEVERLVTAIDEAATAALQRLARESRVTVNTLVQGAWAIVLGHYSRRRDVVFGVTSAGRPGEIPGVETIVGLFINTLPQRVRMRPQAQLVPWLRELQDQQSRQRQFEYTPLADVQRWSELPGGVPLFETILAFENYPVDAARRDGEGGALEIREISAFERTNYPLTVQASVTDRLVLRILFDRHRFEQRSMQRLLGHLRQVLAEMAVRPARRLGEITLLTAEERRRLLAEWNDPRRRPPLAGTLHEGVEERLPGAQDTIAVELEEHALTRAELSRRSHRLARFLQRRGVGPEVRVGVCLDRSLELVVALLGVLRAGGAYVPLDPDYPRQRLRFLYRDSGVGIILSRDALRRRLQEEEDGIDWIALDGERDEAAGESAGPAAGGAAAEHLAYVIYTSGSTGRPKGTLVTHHNALRLFRATEPWFRFGADDVWTLFHSFAFDFSVWELFGALLYGGRLVVVPYAVSRTPEAFYRLLVDRRVTVLNQTPSAFRLLIDAEAEAAGPPPALRRVIFGGEALELETLRRWLERHGEERPRLVNMYGITETTVHVTFRPLAAADLGRGSSVIGRPIPDLGLYLADRGLQLVAPGLAGEIFVGGRGVARGYLGRPRLTARRFLPDPWSAEPGGRLYRSGDLGRHREDGEVEYLGRLDQQVKLRGFRVETGEIETVLNRHPRVRQAVVTLTEGRPGEQRLVAYVVPDLETAGGDEAARRRSGRERVEQWQAVYQETYSTNPDPADPSFNIVGWNSSYTGEPLSGDEMREWVEQTVDRVLALRPRRVLEIGCGTGLLLYRIAPHCERYWATDFSEVALSLLRRKLDEGVLPWAGRVVLLNRLAHDFSAVAERSFDLVILNSVAQYFPGVDYLAEVVEQAVERLAPGGALYLGDLRNLRLQEVFQTSVELADAAPDLPLDALRARVRHKIDQEEELLVDPELFTALAERIPRLGRVVTQLRRGAHHNELTGFRYDAILTVEDGSEVPSTGPALGWDDAWEDLEPVAALLRRDRPEVLRIDGVPNARVAAHCRHLRLLAEHPELEEVGQLVALAAQRREPAIDPERIWRTAQRLGYEARVSWSRRGLDRVDVGLRRRGAPAFPAAAQLPPGGRPLADLANDPMRAVRVQGLVPRLRAFLQERLPQWMVPAHCIVLDELPLTSHGKINHRALPAPVSGRRQLEQPYTAPRNEQEAALARIWGEVLGLDRVGVEDNFFALGGDSIRSIQVQSRARKEGVAFSLQALFKAPTIAQLAALQEPEGAEREPSRAPEPAPFSQLSEPQRARLDAGIEDAFPASRMQAGMLFHSELDPETNVYHDVFTSHLKAPLDPQALAAAVGELVRRHPALRSSFDLTRFSEPLQLVHADVEADFAFDDWSGLDEREASRRIARWVEEEKRRHFDWRRPGLIRFRVHRRRDSFQLTVSFHHSILDGWSVAVMLTELFQLYSRLLHPERALPVAPAPGTGQHDFVALERQALGSQETRRFWEESLRDGLGSRLPRPSTPAGRREIRVQPVPLSRRLAANLSALARSLGVPLKSILLTAHLRLLAAVTGDSRIVTGIITSCRPERSDADRALGLFVNTLPFSIRIEPASWEALIRRTFEREQALLPHRRFPLAELQRMNGGEPLFETAFNFVHFHVYQAVRDAGEIEYLGGELATETNLTLLANFNLDISSSELRLELDYDAGQLSAQQMERVAERYRLILSQLAAAPASGHHLQPLLSQEELEQRVRWNATGREHASELGLHALIEQQGARTPEAIAVAFEDQRLSYARLDRQAGRLACTLRRLGVGAEVRVGICLERSAQLVVALLGVLKAGGAYVPLDPSHPAERLAYSLRDARARVLVTDARRRQRLPAAGAEVVCVDDLPAADVAADRPGRTAPQGLAYVIYTSGSTGNAKGVMIPHRGIVNRLLWMQETYRLDATDRVLQKTPYTFDVSVWELFWPLTAGATLVMARPEGHRDPGYLQAVIGAEKITTLHFVPSMLSAFLAAGETLRLPSLRRVICSGEALGLDQAERFFQSIDAELHNLYGPTEASVDVSFWQCRRGESSPTVPIGRPIANTSLHVLNPLLQSLPVGAAGELYIGGIGVGRGYQGLPGLTAEKFVPDLFSAEPGSRLYRTGDRVRFLEDGDIEFLGRIDFQVKIRGVRIEPGEIESVLADHPGVRQAVVGVRPSESGPPALVCGLVPAPGARLDQGELLDFLSSRLPDPMVPRRFKIVDALPLQSNGKLDRRAAAALLEDAQPVARAPHVPPTSAAERLVAGIWSRVLEVEELGIRDSFFELGGNSINATQLVARLRDAFQVDLPLARLFEAPTVEGVVDCLAQVWASRATVEEIAQAVLEVDELSEAEVERLLANG